MSTNTDTTRLEQFADDHDAALDGLALDASERLNRELSKVGSLTSRGMDERAESIERDVLAELEAAAESDDGGDDVDAEEPASRGHEIELPEGVSVEQAAAVIDSLGTIENPVVISEDTLGKAFDAGSSVPDTLSQVPETQSGGSESDPGGDEGAAFDPGGLSLADRDRLTTLRSKVSTFRVRGMKRADTLEAEMAEIAGVESADAIEWDAL